jgi:peptide/nickel transport system ATP-binding protein
MAPVDDVLRHPGHPYSSGLLRSLPGLSERGARLPSIAGRVPSPDRMPHGCRFQARCSHAAEGCDQPQQLEAFDRLRQVRCCRKDELALPGAVN